MLDAQLVDEIRRVVRLEALRSAAFSYASESLDEHITRMVVAVELQGESLEATICHFDASGVMIGGGTL
jgi:hypothetical protein